MFYLNQKVWVGYGDHSVVHATLRSSFVAPVLLPELGQGTFVTDLFSINEDHDLVRLLKMVFLRTWLLEFFFWQHVVVTHCGGSTKAKNNWGVVPLRSLKRNPYFRYFKFICHFFRFLAFCLFIINNILVFVNRGCSWIIYQ